MKTTGEILNDLRTRAGLSLEKVAEAAGYAGRSGIQRLFSASMEKRLSVDVAEKLAAALQGHGSPPIRRDEVLILAGIPAAPEAGHRSDRPEQPIVRSADAGEIVEITRLDLSLPMGPGATVDDYIEHEPFQFDLAYVRSFTRTPAARLRLAQGVGDSMYPTLLPGDLVWIDSTQRDLNHSDRIYAVSINGGAAIKRLRPLRDGRVLVMSDNPGPGHDSYEVGRDEILIGGRVIRFARDL